MAHDPIPSPAARPEPQALRIAGLLIVGYMAYYFCRTNFSVARPLLVAELAQQGMTSAEATIALGRVATIGVLAGLLAKLVAGSLVDRFGGKRCFLIGMAGAIAATAAFGANSSVLAFTAAWVVNRLFQALGWPATVRIVGSWFPAHAYGRAMGVLSLSWLFGDAASRAAQAQLIAGGVGWRGVYYASAGGLAVVALACVFLLSERQHTAEPTATRVESTEPVLTVHDVLKRRSFWLLCLGAFGFTLVNVTLSEWLPLYFTQTAHLSESMAGRASALFPLFGGISAVLFGAIGDRVAMPVKSRLVAVSLLLTALAMGAFLLPHGTGLSVVLVCAIGLLCGGPYAYAVGAAALDLIGKRGAATINGAIDGVGYCGALLAGEGIARLAVRWGWNGAFGFLASLTLIAAIVALAATLRSEGQHGR